jgi:hypothetical protein
VVKTDQLIELMHSSRCGEGVFGFNPAQE